MQIRPYQDPEEVTLDISLPSKRFYEALGYAIVEECSYEVENGDQLVHRMAKMTLRQYVDERA